MLRKLTGIFNIALEPYRAALDYALLHLRWSDIKEKVPDGDGHPVLFIPGFLTHDALTGPLRRCADEKGYKTYGWDNGCNLGFDEATAKHLVTQLKKIYEENGHRKISLVGHSLGGVYARELAREYPKLVRNVVTLGSPFGKLDRLDEATSRFLSVIYKVLNPQAGPLQEEDFAKRSLTPPPVPTTSIYSRKDDIVHWKASLNPRHPKAENIEIDGGHIGLVFNPLMVTAVLDRLAQPARNWQRFSTRHYAKLLFPKKAKHTPPRNPRWKKTKRDNCMFAKHKPD